MTFAVCVQCARRNIIDADRTLCRDCESAMLGIVSDAQPGAAERCHPECSDGWCHVEYVAETGR